MATNDWQNFYAIFERELIDGTRGSGRLMRRRGADGKWEYRQQKPEEGQRQGEEEAW